MGWSIENVRPQLDAIFANEGKRYSVQHPQAMSPRVYLQHEGDISDETRWLITALFPDEVYIDFFPKIIFGDEPAKLVKKMGTTRIGK